jgi:hypothetical protein
LLDSIEKRGDVNVLTDSSTPTDDNDATTRVAFGGSS